MARFLANENVSRRAIEAARSAGLDIAWIGELSPGATDSKVLAMALAEDRVLVMFDKDFGEMAFRQGLKATCGVVLLRPRLHSPQFVAQFVPTVLTQPIAWIGHFCVATEGRLRTIPLPE